MPTVRQKCLDCGVELSYTEWAKLHQYCYICNRLRLEKDERNDKNVDGDEYED